MDDADEPTFSGQEASEVQTALRRALDLEPEQFPLPAFVGMISDEIDQLRDAGKDDDAIAALVSAVSGKTITAEQIGRYYASPEDRGHFGGEER